MMTLRLVSHRWLYAANGGISIFQLMEYMPIGITGVLMFCVFLGAQSQLMGYWKQLHTLC